MLLGTRRLVLLCCWSFLVGMFFVLYTGLALARQPSTQDPDLKERWLPDPNRELTDSEKEIIERLLKIASSAEDKDVRWQGYIQVTGMQLRMIALDHLAEGFAHKSMLPTLETLLFREMPPELAQDARHQVISIADEVEMYKCCIVRTIAMIDTPEAVEIVIRAVGYAESYAVRFAAQKCLTQMSGHSAANIRDPQAAYAHWKQWWEQTKNSYVNKVHQKARTLVAQMCDPLNKKRLKAAAELTERDYALEPNLLRTALLVPYFRQILDDPECPTNVKVGILGTCLPQIASNEVLTILIPYLESDNNYIYWQVLYNVERLTAHFNCEPIPSTMPYDPVVRKLPPYEERRRVREKWESIWKKHQSTEFICPPGYGW